MAKRIASNEFRRAQIELDKLKPGAVVLDAWGRAWQLGDIYWYCAYGDTSQFSSYDLSFKHPFRVIWSA